MRVRDEVQRGFSAVVVFVVAALSGLRAEGTEPIFWRSGSATVPLRSAGEIREILQVFQEQDQGQHLVVQFSDPVDDALRASLDAAGLRLLGYLGSNAFFASISLPVFNADAVSQVPSLVGVQRIEAAWKVHPHLTPASGVSPPILDENNGNPLVGLYVVFHRDVPLAHDARALVEARGGVVLSSLESVNTLVVTLPVANVQTLANDDAVQWIEPPLPPIIEINNITRAVTQAEVVQAPPYGLSGSGVNVLVFDGGYADASHPDFSGRLTARDLSGLSDHATHVSCTVGGNGAASGGSLRGMAPGVTIQSYGFDYDGSGIFLYTNPGDLESDYNEAINVYNADLSNNSIGTNTCANGFPCAITGDYGVTDQMIDAIVRGSLGTPFRVVWANGNERSCSRCRTEGVHTPEGYHSTAPPACAKNHITVGALEDNETVSTFTSWGPTDDGRLKPDLSAPGVGVTSCIPGGSYASASGTSMASPAVAGISALLLQDYRAQFPARPDPRNSTLKILLAHTALDIENPGPDFKTGYGSVKIQQAIDFMRGNAGRNFLEGSVSQGEAVVLAVRVNPGDTMLKVTLAWDDFPGTLNVSQALINDLDLRVFDPGTTRHFPWTLNPAAPAAPAVRTQADHVNNIEQVVVSAPMPGLWLVEVHGFNVPEGPVVFSLAASPLLTSDCDGNGVPDDQQILADPSLDCSGNGVLDSCEPDCDGDGLANSCEILAGALDCNGNGAPDDCDISGGSIPDCQPNGVPDDCEADCNNNNIPDDCDIAGGTSPDCEPNGVPDECEPDCNHNAVPDGCDILSGGSTDCQPNGVPDECELSLTPLADSFTTAPVDPSRWCAATGVMVDGLGLGEPSPPNSVRFNGPAVLESCVLDLSAAPSATLRYWFEQTGGGESPDPGDDLFAEYLSSNNTWVPLAQHLGSGPNMAAFQEQVAALPADGLHAGLKIRFRATGDAGFDDWFVDDVALTTTGADCNSTGVPDTCDIADGTSQDCGGNGIPDECEPDCNQNGTADDCDIVGGSSSDCQPNGIPDDCEPDCNGNGVADECDLSAGTDQDCNSNDIPDACDIAGGGSLDCQPNGIPDECELPSSILVNGGFETGDFTGWSQVNIGSGGIAINDGTLDPDGPDGPLPPCFGSFASVTFQTGPGTHSLYQQVTIPPSTSSAVLTWTDRIRNHADSYADPDQEFRVEVWDTNNLLLAELFSTAPGFPLLNSCVTRSADVSAYIGQTVRVAFTQQDSLWYFNVHLDDVALAIDTATGDTDCNGNRVPDQCDIAGGTSADCQPDGVPDECQPDCNQNGIADGCDIAGGTSTDCEPNGIPDECEVDCNGNGVSDACDIAGGGSQDCQADGVPDECQLLGTFTRSSGSLSPIDSANPQSYTLVSPPPASSDVTLAFTAVADLDASTEYIDVDINGTFVGRIFEIGASQCPPVPNSAGILVPAAVYNAAVGGGNATIRMVASAAVTPGICTIPFITASVSYAAGGDCNGNAVPDSCDIASGSSPDCEPDGVPDDCEPDCNANGVADACDIAGGSIPDCQPNGIPDDCEPDCNGNGVSDSCDLSGGTSQDCNHNDVPDECDIAGGASSDCEPNGVPDECEADCNGNGVSDGCDIAGGASADCQGDGVPDECQLIGTFTRSSGTLSPVDSASPRSYVLLAPPPADSDVTLAFTASADLDSSTEYIDVDLNGTAVGRIFQTGAAQCPAVPNTATLVVPRTAYNALLAGGDVTVRMVASAPVTPGICVAPFITVTISYSAGRDCNGNSVPDTCDIASGSSSDCQPNDIPDECEPDCNNNGSADDCDIAGGSSLDCQPNGLPDECEPDCNGNGAPDDCDLAGGGLDCNNNGVVDECDIAAGTSADCEPNGVPDECDPDCNHNGTPDGCDLIAGTSEDCQPNGVPDECEVPAIALADSFATTTIDPARWCFVNGVVVDALGLSEPSPPYSLRLNGSDRIESCNLGVTLGSGATLRYWFERTGGGDPPDPGKDLLVEYLSSAGTWVMLAQHLGGEPNMIAYQQRVLALAPAAVHAGLRFRFRSTGDPGYDDWFVDDIEFTAGGADCNATGVPDECDIAAGTSQDCQGDLIPDECQLIGDFSVASGFLSPIDAAHPQSFTLVAPRPPLSDVTLMFTASADLDSFNEYVDVDLNGTFVGRVFQIGAGQCTMTPSGASLIVPAAIFRAAVGAGDATLRMTASSSVTPGVCTPSMIAVTVSYEAGGDCNNNAVPDSCDIASGGSFDCQPNGLPDECEPDCNGNGVADDCDIAGGTSADCQNNGIPDDCEPDCNANSVADDCDIAGGTSDDCQANGIPDECEPDCNANSVADDCDIAGGSSIDCESNGIPDECETDCNVNGISDSCDLAGGSSADCNASGVPDECEPDTDQDGAIDDCDVCPLDLHDDGDGDGACDSDEECPADPYKLTAGQCGCGVADVDSDADTVADCVDLCADADDRIFAPGCVEAIPAVSSWGMAILGLSLLCLIKLAYGRALGTRNA
ncbi:MAG: S8 family serine peptidase [Planctomycetes bacterium]|nr:S8 family serine peptidase [Planctomycetota bacterium]